MVLEGIQVSRAKHLLCAGYQVWGGELCSTSSLVGFCSDRETRNSHLDEEDREEAEEATQAV